MTTHVKKAIQVAAIAAVSTFVLVAPLSAATAAEELRLAGVDPHITATQVDDITILKGTTSRAGEPIHAISVLHRHGFARVANLVRFVAVPDDETIERAAERRIFMTRSLDGSHLHVNCVDGYLTVAGTVARNVQKDIAREVLSRLSGVKNIQMILGDS